MQEDNRSTYSSKREGVLGDWTFVEREIRKFSNNPTYTYFDTILKKKDKNEIEKRILSAIVWLYDAVMNFSPVNRFVMLMIALEVLFVSGNRNQKSFKLARFSVLLSHLYIFKDWKCLCPILESHSTKEYMRQLNKLNLPGMCSAYWNIRKWYEIRSGIVHDAIRFVNQKDLESFEWWTHQLISATTKIVNGSKISTLDELEIFLEVSYREKKKSL